MKNYESYYFGFAEEFTVSAFLGLEDDGRFYYSEAWISYGGGTGGEVQGIWRQAGDTLFLLAERKESPISLNFVEGQELQATMRGDIIDFGNDLTLSLKRDDPVQDAQLPKVEEVIEPVEATKKKPASIIANFHFKDGRIEERQLPNDPLFGSFNQLFYRLVDENGRAVNFFKLRQESQTSDSLHVEFDEIDMTPTEESDGFSD